MAIVVKSCIKYYSGYAVLLCYTYDCEQMHALQLGSAVCKLHYQRFTFNSRWHVEW